MTHEQLQAAQRAALSMGFNITSEVAAAVFQAMTAAALAPSAEVEAVEVVGVRISSDGFGSYIADSAMGIGALYPGDVREPLMTVAQHQRIVAAKDAEIARLAQELHSTQVRLTGMTYDRNCRLEERDELRAQLAELRGCE